MKADLDGKIAFVTGSTQGIGKAIALKLAENGADVAINGRNPGPAAKVQELITNLGRRCILGLGDVLVYDDIKRVVDDILAKWGTIDILVVSGSAGHPPPRLFHEIPPELYLEYLRTRLISRLFPIRAVLHHMQETRNGKIIIITTDAGRVPTPGESLIGASAAGVVLVTKVLAQEFAPWKIRINTICVTITGHSPKFLREFNCKRE